MGRQAQMIATHISTWLFVFLVSGLLRSFQGSGSWKVGSVLDEIDLEFCEKCVVDIVKSSDQIDQTENAGDCDAEEFVNQHECNCSS